MHRLVSVEHFRALPGDNMPPQVVDLEQPEWAHAKRASIEVRAKSGIMSVTAHIEAKSYDDDDWTSLGMVTLNGNDERVLSVELDPDKELVRWNVKANSLVREVYVRFSVSEDEESNDE